MSSVERGGLRGDDLGDFKRPGLRSAAFVDLGHNARSATPRVRLFRLVSGPVYPRREPRGGAVEERGSKEAGRDELSLVR